MDYERNRHDNSSKSKQICSLVRDPNGQRCFSLVFDYTNNNAYEATIMRNTYAIYTPPVCFVFLLVGFEIKMFCNELSVGFQ